MATKRTPGRNEAGAHLVVDNLQALQEAIGLLARTEVLVGVPEEKTERDDGETLTNAAIAYIQDNGAPEVNIPARPFMIPGINSVKPQLVKELIGTARRAAKASQPKKGQRPPSKADVAKVIEQGLHRVGLTASTGIKNKISEGIPPPLSERTLKARAARGRKGASDELQRRARGEAPSIELAKPLEDTGEMRNSVTYAIRDKAARKS